MPMSPTHRATVLASALFAASALAISLLAVPALAQGAGDADVDFVETSTGGHAIVVPRAVLPQAGFIALHDSTLLTDEDSFGSVIGVSKLLPAGTHVDILVELGPVPGNDKAFTSNANDTIIAMPHKDSNNNSVYDFITSQGADDGPFTGGMHATQTFAGNIVIAADKVNRGSATSVVDQYTDGSTFKVAFVDLSEAGFVALHDMSLVTDQDPFGSVLGVSAQLDAGLHRNVMVQFGNAPGATHKGKLTSTQDLIAMPHKDSNNNSVYDFITSQGADDGPFPGAAQTFVGKIDIAQATATLSGAYGSGSSSAASSSRSTAGGSMSEDHDDEDGKGTPGLGALALLGVVAVAAMVASRRR
ncbi:MAG TPA: hypothetical protein VM327_01655 [Candidatus Thermoplasmatota archaeon]|nr:hypothetical protein [Candidatus Thermoplasmatota archaeon]